MIFLVQFGMNLYDFQDYYWFVRVRTNHSNFRGKWIALITQVKQHLQ